MLGVGGSNPLAPITFRNKMSLFFFFIHHLGHFLPRPVAEFITRRIADICYFTLYREGRNNYLKNIEPVIGGFSSKREMLEMGLKGVRDFAVFIYEFLLVPRLKRWNYRRFMIPVNFERAAEAFKRGKGVIILTAHLGNYEWGAVLLRLQGYPLSVISIRSESQYITEFYERKRRSQEIEVIYTGKASIGAIKSLKRGKMVAIVGDRVFTEDGIEVEMFGKKTLLPKGPFYLALLTGAPIIPAFSVKERDRKYHVYFESEIEIEKYGNTERTIEKNIHKWAKILEKYIKRYPEQWHRFDRVWIE